MGKLTDLLVTDRRPGPVCSITARLLDLPDDDAATLRTALDDPVVTGATIARALTTLGYKTTGNTVQRHRRGECSCGTPS